LRKLCPLLPLVLLMLLAACNPGTSGDANLTINSVNMLGIKQTDVQVNADGSWTIESNASWLSVSPTSGTGDATVTLTVNPDLLEPGKYTTSLTLRPQDFPSRNISVDFAFPRLTGSVVVGPLATTESPNLLSTQALPSGPGTLLVGLREPASPQVDRFGRQLSAADGFRALAANVASQGRGIRLHAAHKNSRVAVMEVDDMRAAKALLERDPNVRYVEPDILLETLADPERHKQWALDLVDVDEAWLTSEGLGVRVAVIDAGFHPAHPDYDGNVTATFDFTANQETIVDRPACGTHGDHVAGIVAAEAGNGIGVEGIAPQAKLALLNIGFETVVNGETVCPLSGQALIDALEWVIGASGVPRAEVVNMSLGGGYSAAIEDAVEAVYAAGITMVAAAGNSPTGSVLYPAAYPQVIAVSATTDADTIASYSTTGSQVFVSAPGGDGPFTSQLIYSTYYSEDLNPESARYTYGYMRGTSMASPAVAAVAALSLAVNPDLRPIGVAGLLADSSVDLGSAGRDDTFGYGRVSAYEAVQRAELSKTQPVGYLIRGPGWEYALPAVESFKTGYVDEGSVTLQVGSDENWNGVLNELGEYYGEKSVNIQFNGEFFDVGIITVEEQQLL
jgi:subtilisin family serine protease